MVHKRKVAIVTDSSSCLPRDLLEKWSIHVVPHELVINERTYRDGIDIEPGDFYQLLQKNQSLPTTSSPSPSSFLNAFRSTGTTSEGVVCITLSANFSATYDSACSAARTAAVELPGCRFEVVDSRAAAGAEGLIALEAARSVHEGADLDGVVSRIQELIPEVNLLAFLDTLYYLRKSGRVPKVAAWAGSLLGIRPMTELKLGKAYVVGKPRSRAKATEKLLSIMRSRIAERPAHVNVMHANSGSDAETLCRRIEAEFNCQELFISEFTPVMGSHLGPGLLGLAFYADGSRGRL